MTDTGPSLGETSRKLLRNCDRAVLATLQQDDAKGPYASLVMIAVSHAGQPILLISDLAEHTKNIAADNRVSLLLDGTGGFDDPLTGPRLTVQGRAVRTEDPDLQARFIARHPSAAMYAGFGDFNFYEIEILRGHLVAGFGQIDWVEKTELLFDVSACMELQVAEADILTHMNDDHHDAIQLYANNLLGLEGNEWRLTGVDPEGVDIAQGSSKARLDFEQPVCDADSARMQLVGMVKRAREERKI